MAMVHKRSDRLRNLLGLELLYLLVGGFALSTVILAVLLVIKPTTREYNALIAQLAALKQPAPKPLPMMKRQDQPPIIRLAEADGYRFASGSADVSSAFITKLDRVIPQILALVSQYDVDTVEVVGHTDGVPMRGKGSTLDVQLAPYINGASATPPTAADNTGLGMIRAAAVAKLLHGDARLAGLHVVALSAGQMVLADGLPAEGGDLLAPGEDRRRIEIRLRRNKL